MQTPEQRYHNDVAYRQLTDVIESLIHTAHFTPSEVRECAVLACIHFQMRQEMLPHSIPQRVIESLHLLESWRSGEPEKRHR